MNRKTKSTSKLFAIAVLCIGWSRATILSQLKANCVQYDNNNSIVQNLAENELEQDQIKHRVALPDGLSQTKETPETPKKEDEDADFEDDDEFT